MASGIAINPAVQTTFEKLNKREHSIVILKINAEMTEVSVEKAVPATDKDVETEWKELLKSLPLDDCRYVLADFRWKETPTVTKSKLILILWSPEDAPIRPKMIYASSQEAVLAKVSVSRVIQANESDDITYATVKDGIAN